MVVIADSSTLIPLALINQLRLLEEMFGGVLIPQSIYDEIVTEGEGRAGAEEIKNASFIQVENLANPDDAEEYIDPLSRPDAEIIVLAKEQTADLILTRDRRLRRRASQEGLTIISLFDLFVFGKQRGFVQEVQPLLDELRGKAF